MFSRDSYVVSFFGFIRSRRGTIFSGICVSFAFLGRWEIYIVANGEIVLDARSKNLAERIKITVTISIDSRLRISREDRHWEWRFSRQDTVYIDLDFGQP